MSDETTPPDDVPAISLEMLTRPIYQVSVRTADRVVTQMGTFTPSLFHRNIDGTSAIEGGIGAHDGCVVEEVSEATYQALQAALSGSGEPHGGAVLAPDHSTVSLAPESDEARAFREALDAHTARRAADLATLAASDDVHHQAMARLLAGG